ncbi:uncharacterized protein [Physcomitrium patens]|uniref:uncharacterized protein n=1 Tax=Physcomitrium patens TaxID=3218 RepID=UPI003CCCD54D
MDGAEVIIEVDVQGVEYVQPPQPSNILACGRFPGSFMLTSMVVFFPHLPIQGLVIEAQTAHPVLILFYCLFTSAPPILVMAVFAIVYTEEGVLMISQMAGFKERPRS